MASDPGDHPAHWSDFRNKHKDGVRPMTVLRAKDIKIPYIVARSYGGDSSRALLQEAKDFIAEIEDHIANNTTPPWLWRWTLQRYAQRANPVHTSEWYTVSGRLMELFKMKYSKREGWR